MQENKKMTVEAANRHIRLVWSAVRQQLKMRGHTLDAQMMSEVHGLLPRLAEIPEDGVGYYLNGTKITPKGLGNVFVVEHLVEALKNKEKLTRPEEKLIRHAFGGIYRPGHSLPKREYQNRITALESLDAREERGKTLFSAISKEIDLLLVEHRKPMKHNGDMFKAPIKELWNDCTLGSFKDIAEVIKQIYIDPDRKHETNFL